MITWIRGSSRAAMTPGSPSLFLAAAMLLFAAAPHAARAAFLFSADFSVHDDYGQATSPIDRVATSPDAARLTLFTPLSDWGVFPASNEIPTFDDRPITWHDTARKWRRDVPSAPSAAFNGAALASRIVLLAAIDEPSPSDDRFRRAHGSLARAVRREEAPPLRDMRDASDALALTAAFDSPDPRAWAERRSTPAFEFFSGTQAIPERPTLALVGVGLF